MNEWVSLLNDVSAAWAEALFRACWQGGGAILAVWFICRGLAKIPAFAQCWLWRLACLKLFIVLLWTTPLVLPVLPARISRDVGGADTKIAAASPQQGLRDREDMEGLAGAMVSMRYGAEDGGLGTEDIAGPVQSNRTSLVSLQHVLPAL